MGLPHRLRNSLLEDDAGLKILVEMAKRCDPGDVVERLAGANSAGAPETGRVSAARYADDCGGQPSKIGEKAIGGAMQNNAESKVWEVMPPSIENQNPAPEAQQDIDAYLTEHPVRLGAIAERHGIKELVSALPCGISGQSGNELGGIAIRIKLHEASHRQRFTLAHE